MITKKKTSREMMKYLGTTRLTDDLSKYEVCKLTVRSLLLHSMDT